MKTFIVHICREGSGANPEPIGIVEEAGSEEKSRFNGFDELRRIMGGVKTPRKGVTKRSLKK